jgi:RNA polymerase sigma factor (sigma-70 family)
LVALWATKVNRLEAGRTVEPRRGVGGTTGVGIDAMPRPASGLPARLVLGPALRAQSDGRLVRLVRDGYESAFEEIVRRYRRPLDRFAASIVGGRSEDVTQDSFRKALVALRGDDAEIELRPWLYRIVRNTALNDLRDRPPAAAELADDLMAGGRSAAAVAEERAEVAALTARMRALPEKQRAALVMRELEGMGHEEIAAALGISGGAARQAIARARTAVRSGFGALVPLPLLRALASGDAASEAGAGAAGGVAGAGGAAAAGGAVGGTGAAAGGGAAGALGGVGAGGLGGVLKVGLATVVVAGSIGTGVAIDHHGGGHHQAGAKGVASAPGGPRGDGVRSTPSPVIAGIDPSSGHGGDDQGDDSGRSGRGGDDGRGSEGGRGDRHDIDAAVAEPVDHGDGLPDDESDGPGTAGTSGGGRDSSRGGGDDNTGGGQRGSGPDGEGSGGDDDSGRSGHDGGSGGSDSGRGRGGSGGSGSGRDSSGRGSGSGRGDSGHGSGSGRDQSGSGSGSGSDGGRDSAGGSAGADKGGGSSGSSSGSGSHDGGSGAGSGSDHTSGPGSDGGSGKEGGSSSGGGDSSSPSSGSTDGGHGSDGTTEAVIGAAPTEPSSLGPSSGGDGTGSSSSALSTSDSSGGPSATLEDSGSDGGSGS